MNKVYTGKTIRLDELARQDYIEGEIVEDNTEHIELTKRLMQQIRKQYNVSPQTKQRRVEIYNVSVQVHAGTGGTISAGDIVAGIKNRLRGKK